MTNLGEGVIDDVIVGDSVSGSPAVSHPWPLLLLLLLPLFLLSSGGNHCYCPTSLVAPTHSIHLIDLHNHFGRNTFRRCWQNMNCWAATIKRSSKLTAQNRSHPSLGVPPVAPLAAAKYTFARAEHGNRHNVHLCPAAVPHPSHPLSLAAGAFLLSSLLPG